MLTWGSRGRMCVVGASALLIAVAATAPVAAQQVDPVSALSGVAVRHDGGFTLVEHRVWTSPAVTATDRPASYAVQGPEHIVGPGCDMTVATMPGVSRSTRVRRQIYGPSVRSAECRHGLPPGLLDSLIVSESRYVMSARSAKGALGLTQLMPGTAGSLRVADPSDPVANIDGGARYLRSMLDKFRSVPLALAAYNAGPGAVSRAGGIPFNHETPSYVLDILKRWNAMLPITTVDRTSPGSAIQSSLLHVDFITASQ